MIRIGDFSKLSRVSIKTLHFYDEMGLLKPVEVDRFTGYRYYEFDQLPRLYRTAGFASVALKTWASHWRRSAISSKEICPPSNAWDAEITSGGDQAAGGESGINQRE